MATELSTGAKCCRVLFIIINSLFLVSGHAMFAAWWGPVYLNTFYLFNFLHTLSLAADRTSHFGAGYLAGGHR